VPFLKLEANITELLLSFNVDGLSLFNSSNASFWPILCMLKSIKGAQPYVVALFYGKQKPRNLDFLTDLIAEAKVLSSSSIEHLGRHFDVKIHSIICGAPAKCMVKGIVRYN